MGNILGHSKHSSKKLPSVTEADKAILALKAQRKKLSDQQKLLELRIDRHVEVARELLAEKKKDRALLVIKKKKLVEKQLEELGQHQLNIEGMISNVESSTQQNKVFQVLQKGNETLKQLQKEVTAEDVRRLLDDTAEAKAQQDEIAELLGESHMSEEDIEAAETELQALEAEHLAAEVAKMPSVPATTPVQVPTTAAVPAKQQQQAAEEQEAETEEEAAKPTALLAS